MGEVRRPWSQSRSSRSSSTSRGPGAEEVRPVPTFTHVSTLFDSNSEEEDWGDEGGWGEEGPEDGGGGRGGFRGRGGWRAPRGRGMRRPGFGFGRGFGPPPGRGFGPPGKFLVFH